MCGMIKLKEDSATTNYVILVRDTDFPIIRNKPTSWHTISILKGELNKDFVFW